MLIHVVRSGETLWQITARYKVNKKMRITNNQFLARTDCFLRFYQNNLVGN
ncbi:LysM peptidoglycan-binding domain-containing protein [Neobacillus drentensis]|uniref:LysM peptidoglycan-binding domain-containing protein n=1 Tax=Neobacillus drentensis TaxID=220684 RepID=UPI000A9818AE|nr:LysM domain-containing protein [Neobacillus drentensis]